MISSLLFVLSGIVPAIIAFILVSHNLRKEEKRLHEKLEKILNLDKEIVIHPTPINVDLEPLERTIRDLPTKVLHSIQGSINGYKGALGELIGYIELRNGYDRILPLGNIVDFICIRFPTEENEGVVDFVDVKTGSSSRLSKDQRLLQDLINTKKIGFIKLTITDNKIAGNDS